MQTNDWNLSLTLHRSFLILIINTATFCPRTFCCFFFSFFNYWSKHVAADSICSPRAQGTGCGKVYKVALKSWSVFRWESNCLWLNTSSQPQDAPKTSWSSTDVFLRFSVPRKPAVGLFCVPDTCVLNVSYWFCRSVPTSHSCMWEAVREIVWHFWPARYTLWCN